MLSQKSSLKLRAAAIFTALALSLAAPVHVLAASPYTPTMADMMSINATLHRYLMGLDNKDAKLLASAFTTDATFAIYAQGAPGSVVRGRAAIEAARSKPPLPGRETPAGMFHAITNDAWEFVSPTQVKHFAYWHNVVPQEGQASTIAHAGRYEDVLVKENGEWLIKERKIFRYNK